MQVHGNLIVTKGTISSTMIKTNYIITQSAVVFNCGIDVIKFSTYGIDDPEEDSSLWLNNYPYPFSGYTFLTYSLPSEGHVILFINIKLVRNW